MSGVITAGVVIGRKEIMESKEKEMAVNLL